MNIWHDISPKRIKTDDFCAVIEITKGSKAKYELDKETGLLFLDRILYTSTHYPANYGFIPRTYAEDHDPLDVLVLCSENIHPLSLVRCYPIGVISMEDNGSKDEKLLPSHSMTQPTTVIRTSANCLRIFSTRCPTFSQSIRRWRERRPRLTMFSA